MRLRERLARAYPGVRLQQTLRARARMPGISRKVRAALLNDRGKDDAVLQWEEAAKAHVAKRVGRAIPGRRKKLVWDADIQALVIEGLRLVGNVMEVARKLDVPTITLYRRRVRDWQFKRSWEKAMGAQYDALEAALCERLTNGWDEDVWYQGKCVGTRRVYDHTNGMKLLQVLAKKEAEEAAARAEAEARAAETGKADDPEAKTEAARRRLWLHLMTRHRNMKPEEWDGSVHLASGLDLDDWEAWLDEREKEKEMWEKYQMPIGTY